MNTNSVNMPVTIIGRRSKFYGSMNRYHDCLLNYINGTKLYNMYTK